MTVRIVHKSSSASAKNPTAAQLANGEIAVNYHEDGPFLSVKDTGGNIIRVGGVWIAENSPANPAKGAWWLKESTGALYVRTDTQWVSVSGGGGNGGGNGDITSVQAGNGITVADSGGPDPIVSVNIDSAENDSGLRFDGTELLVKPATASALGSVSVGAGLNVTAAGELSATGGGGLVYIAALDTTTTGPTQAAAAGHLYLHTGGDGTTVAGFGSLAITTNDRIVRNGANTAWEILPVPDTLVSQNLSRTLAANQTTINIDQGGSSAIIPLGDGTNAGVTLNDFTTAEKNKLAGLSNGASVSSITPGDGIENATTNDKTAITGAGTLALDLAANSGLTITGGSVEVDLEAAGADTGGLALDGNQIRVVAGAGIEATASGIAVDLAPGNNGLELTANDGSGELRVDAGDGIELTANGVAVNLSAAPNGLELTATDGTGELQINPANITPPPNGAMGHWTRANATNTLSPRTANDNIDQGTGNITTTGNTSAANVTATGNLTVQGNTTLGNANTDTAQVSGSLTLTGPGADLVLTGTDNAGTPNQRTITVQAPTGSAAFTDPYTATLPADVPAAGEVLTVNAVAAGPPAVATLEWAAAGTVEWEDRTVNIGGTNYDYLRPITGTDRVAIREGGTAALPGFVHEGDENTGISFVADDQINISTGGAERLRFTDTAVIANPANLNVNFVVESDTPANADVLTVDVSDDRVGINDATPTTALDVTGAIKTNVTAINDNTAFDIRSSNVYTAAAIQIANPTNTANAIGMSGLIVMSAAPTAWGNNWDHSGGAAPAPTQFPAIVPFYVRAENAICVGRPTEDMD